MHRMMPDLSEAPLPGIAGGNPATAKGVKGIYTIKNRLP